MINVIKSLVLFFSPRSEERVLDAVIKSSVINLLARGFGYAKHLSIAILLGFSYETDAFFMALSLIGIFLIFADVFDSIGVPQLVRARMQSEEAYKRFASLLLTFTVFLSFGIIFLSIALMPLILKIPAGFAQEALEKTRRAYLFLIPYLSLNFLFHHFGAILRSRRRFTAYFVGEFIFSFSTFLFITLGLLLFRDSLVLPVSFSISQIIATLYMLFVGRQFLHLTFYRDDTTKKLIYQFFQLSLLYGVFHLYILVDRTFASFLGEKAVSALAYGFLLAGIPKGILKFENIAITSLSESGGSLEKLNFYLKRLIFLTVPMVLFFFLFSEFVVKLLFGYGAFSHMDIKLSAEALRYYALSIPFMFFWPLIYRVFQIRETLFVVGVFSLAGVFINGLLNYFFVFYLKLGLAGICIGTLGAYIFICAFSYLFLYLKKEVNCV